MARSKCDICGKAFGSKRDLHLHKAREHITTPDMIPEAGSNPGGFGGEAPGNWMDY